MSTTASTRLALVGCASLLVSCGGGASVPPPASPQPAAQQHSGAPPPPGAPQPAAAPPAVTITGTDGTHVTVHGDAVGGGPLLQETMGAIAVHNTLQESAASSEQAARASQHVAREQIGRIGDERAAQMDSVLDSMGQ